MKGFMTAVVLLAAMAVMTLAATAGTPNSVRIGIHGRGLWEATLNRTTAMASAAIDTVFLDMKDAQFPMSGAAATVGGECFIYFDNLATGDSLTCVIASCPENETNACLANIASFQVTGGAAATISFEKAMATPPCRYWRVIITNNQAVTEAAIDYLCRIQMQAAP